MSLAIPVDFVGMNLTPAEHERFMSKTAKQGDCWLWQAPLDKDGYGVFYLRRRPRRAHRVGWYMLRGEIPAGMVINHVCGNRHCVNPQHLEMVTVRENALKDSRSLGALNARKMHCPEGHNYDRVYSGQRYCSTCEATKARRLRAKWRAEDTLAV